MFSHRAAWPAAFRFAHLLPPGGMFSSHLSSSGTHCSPGRTRGICPHTAASASPPRGLLHSGKSDPFYYPSCAAETMRSGNIAPEFCLPMRGRFVGNIQITSRFLSSFLRETCKHFVCGVENVKLSSGENAYGSW